MNSQKAKYIFSAKIWYSEWYFVSLPTEMAKEIRENLKYLEEGWGRLKVTARINTSEWETAIWFDTKHQTYFLPIKAEIRKKEKIGVNDKINVTLWI